MSAQVCCYLNRLGTVLAPRGFSTPIRTTLGDFYEAGHFVVCGRADRGDNPPQGGRHHLMTIYPKALANACQMREANLWGQRLQLIIKNSEDA